MKPGTTDRISRANVKNYGTVHYYEYDSTNKKRVEVSNPGSDDNNAKKIVAIIIKGIRIQSNPDAAENIGYVSEISTDIVIEIPKVNFFTVNNKTYDYAIIANNGIDIGNGAKVMAKGSVYGGTVPFAGDFSSYNNSYEYGGIHVGENAKFIIEDAEYVVSGGDIYVEKDGLFEVDKPNSALNNQIWFENLEVKGSGATVNISGDIFAADDLQVNSGSDGSSVTLQGSYYGFNDGTQEVEVYEGTTPYKLTTKRAQISNRTPFQNSMGSDQNYAMRSSSIIMNSKDSIIDLSGLKTLMVLGNSYINHESKSGITVDTGKIKDASLPESVALKSSQDLTLVPTEFSGLQNPIVCSSGNDDPYDSKKTEIINGMSSSDWFGHDYVNVANPYSVIKVKDAYQVYAYCYMNFKDDNSKIEYIKKIFEGANTGSAPTAATLKKELLASSKTFNGRIKLGGARVYAKNAILGYDGTDLQFPSDTSVANKNTFDTYSTNLYKRYRLLDTYLDNMSDTPFTVSDSKEFDVQDFKKEDNEMPLGRFFWLWGLRKAGKADNAVSGTFADIKAEASLDPNAATDDEAKKNELKKYGSNFIFLKDSSNDIDLCERLGGMGTQKAIVIIDGNAFVKNDLTINGFVACVGKLTVQDNVKFTVTFDSTLLNRRISEELKDVDKNGGYHDENKPNVNPAMRNLLIYYMMNSDRNLYADGSKYKMPYPISNLESSHMKNNQDIQMTDVTPKPVSYREYTYLNTLGTGVENKINTDYTDFVYFENWKKGQEN